MWVCTRRHEDLDRAATAGQDLPHHISPDIGCDDNAGAGARGGCTCCCRTSLAYRFGFADGPAGQE